MAVGKAEDGLRRHSHAEGIMAQAQQTMQYGLWPSPIGPQSLAEGLRLAEVAWDSDGETLVWLEGRSDRGVLVCLPPGSHAPRDVTRSEEHTSELQSLRHLVCRLLLEKKKKKNKIQTKHMISSVTQN